MEAAKETASNAWTSAKRALSSAPPNDAYLRWDAPGVEYPVPDEEIKTEKAAEVMNKMQRHNFDKVCIFFLLKPIVETLQSSWTNPPPSIVTLFVPLTSRLKALSRVLLPSLPTYLPISLKVSSPIPGPIRSAHATPTSLSFSNLILSPVHEDSA